MDKIFFKDSDILLEDLGNGLSRKICAYNDDLMVCRVHFDKGAIGKMHTHPHSQVTYVLSGEFEVTCENKKSVLKAGDSVYQASNINHGLVCLEEGTILDIFTPCRKDFLN